MFKEWVASFAPMKTAVFSEIWGNPVKSQVTAGVAAYRAAGADSIIGTWPELKGLLTGRVLCQRISANEGCH